jgi:predicted nucleic acid-binding protein
MHIFDTDTLSHLHAGNQNVIRAIRHLGNEEITTTIVTKVEMLRGRIDYIITGQWGMSAADVAARYGIDDRTP